MHSFNLFETFRLDPTGPSATVGLHVDRLVRSARNLGFPCDRPTVEAKLLEAAAESTSSARCRLELARDGCISLELLPLPAAPDGVVAVELAILTVPPDDVRLRHKTTDRAFYDEPRLAAGTFEILFMDRDGFLTEGSFTNIFVERGPGLATPPLQRGLLPGVLRQQLLASGRAFEADLHEADLHDGFYVGNSLRGLIPACLRQSPA